MNVRSAKAKAPARKAARPTAPPLAYTLNDASATSGLSRSTLYRHEKAKRLRFARVGGRTLVIGESLHALIGGAE
jgi:hypothetical protein